MRSWPDPKSDFANPCLTKLRVHRWNFRTPMRSVALPLMLVVAALGNSADTAPSHTSRLGDPWKVTSVDEPQPRRPDSLPTSVIRFSGGFALRPKLYGVSVIGQLPSPGNAPFIAIGGSECDECDLDTESVFIARVTAWPRETKAFQASGPWFSQYPHRNYNAETKTLWDWSRVFIGHCLDADQISIVSFSADRDPNTRTWRHKVKWGSVKLDRLVVREASASARSAPSLNTVTQAVKGGRCRGVHQVTFDEPF